MAIKRRETLYSIFKNGNIPTQNDFRDLIDSALNRRDDQFFGWWQSGMRYCVNDVVIYGKELYQLIEKETEEPCPPEEVSEETETEKECYCSELTPPEDKEHWCILELELKDKDWEIVCEPDGDPDCEVTRIYQKTARVGIGTDSPEARLDITDQNKILLEPNDNGSPDISLRKISNDGEGYPENQHYVRYRLSDEVCWETDSIAYVFKKVIEEEPQMMQKSTDVPESDTMPSILLMKVTADENNIPRVGIGTPAPQGGLHVHQDYRGKVLINPGNHYEPGVLIVNLQEDSNGYYFLTGTNNEYTFLSTNAQGGFRFKKDEKDKEEVLDGNTGSDGNDLMAILGDGRVGIGTIDPKSHVEITDNESGSFRFQLGNKKGIMNPALSINNFRPSTSPNTYLAMGADAAHGSFITDAPSGFAFKAGYQYGKNQNEVDINQGDNVVFISQNGKLGIRTSSTPEDYDLEVQGQTKALTSHLETNSNNIIEVGTLEGTGVLEKLDDLTPIYFNWKENTGLAGEGQQIGFKAESLFDIFDELIKGPKSGNPSLAYGNLTAVLVQAVKDQLTKIGELEQRISDLEERLSPTSKA